MNHATYIQNLFYSFLQKSDKTSGKVMFIKHYNTLQLNLEDIEKIIGEEYKEGLLYHRFSKNDIKEPYEPFMNGIRYYYQKFFSDSMTVEDFLNNCEVYSLHRDIFSSYMTTGFAKRNEKIIVSETAFETKKFMESIINCYNFVSTKAEILMIFNRFEFAGLSTLKFIRQLIENVSLCNIKFMVVYNEKNQPLAYADEEFDGIIGLADNRGILFEWENEDEVTVNDYHSTFIPNRRYFGEYIRKINNLYYMLAIDDAQYYINLIDKRLVEDKLVVDKADMFRLYEYASLCFMLKGDINTSMLMSEKLLLLYDKNTDLMSDYRYNYICGQIQMSLVQSDLTKKYASKCYGIAEQLQDEKLIFLAEVLHQGSQFCGWRDVFSVDFNMVKIQDGMIEKFRKHRFFNTLAYYLIFGYDNDDETVKKMADGILSETYKEAIRIGKELGNTCFLLSAYTKYIIMFTERGYHKNALKFYDEKFKILSNEHNERRKAHLLLGMGYSSIVGEEYSKASSSFMEAIDILYKLRNPEEIAEALYNMAENSICAEDYVSAVEYMTAVLKILDNLGMETIQICNASKLHGLLALAYYKAGNEYKCYKEVGNLETLISHFINSDGSEQDYYRWDEDLFLYYMFTAILEKNSEDYENAGKHFERAMMHFKNCISVAFYAITTFISEYYDYYIKINNSDKAFEILDFGRQYCNENGYFMKAKRLLMIAENKNFTVNYLPTDFGETTIDDLVQLAYNVGKENQLYDSKKDIRFLSMWQEMLNRDDLKYEDIINNSMATLQKNFNLDQILFIEVNKHGTKTIYQDVVVKDEIDYDEIVEFFKMRKTGFIANRNSKNIVEYDKITNLFDRSRLVTIVGIPVYNDNNISNVFIGLVNMHRNFRHNRILMDEERLMIMKTAIIQLTTGIERIKNKQKIVEINQKLNELAITDMLTGLYNRQGLAKLIEQFSNLNNTVAILYADLDNFKYYNDTFGHDVGDVILKEFARVISDMSKNIGYAVRYGGDEFLVVLNNITKEKAKQVAEEIYEAMSDGFVPIVRQHMKKEIEVPRNKYVSCSIGIAFSKDGKGDSIGEALKNADKALYFMKRGTKGNYIFWEDINEAK